MVLLVIFGAGASFDSLVNLGDPRGPTGDLRLKGFREPLAAYDVHALRNVPAP